MSYPHTYGQPRAIPTNSNAVAALVFSLLWGFGLFSLGAVILGHVALHQIRRTGEGGNGLAVAGLILGYLGALPLAVMVVVGIITTIF